MEDQTRLTYGVEHATQTTLCQIHQYSRARKLLLIPTRSKNCPRFCLRLGSCARATKVKDRIIFVHRLHSTPHLTSLRMEWTKRRLLATLNNRYIYGKIVSHRLYLLVTEILVANRNVVSESASLARADLPDRVRYHVEISG